LGAEGGKAARKIKNGFESLSLTTVNKKLSLK